MLAPRLTIPDILLTCPPQPEPPASDSTDKPVAQWIAGLAEAGEACRDNLAAVRGVVRP